MPRSFYKGEWLGKLPACAICMGRGHGPRALSLFQAALRTAHRTRGLPGSYSWRELRREAEERFAAGEPPSAVIDELDAGS